MFEFDWSIERSAEPLGVPALDTGDFALDGGDAEPPVRIAPVGGGLQVLREPVGVVGHALSEPGGHTTTLQPAASEHVELSVALAGDAVPFVGHPVSGVGPEVALVGDAIALGGHAITPFGGGLALVSDEIPIVGRLLALVGQTIPLIGR